MSDIQDMNSEMLDILKNYFELCSIFNEKLEKIKTNEILNINLKLLKASIVDLNINITNFKSNLQYVTDNNKQKDIKENIQKAEHESNQEIESVNNQTELDINKSIAAFFMYLMKIDKDSILNSPTFCKSNAKDTQDNTSTKLQTTFKIDDCDDLD